MSESFLAAARARSSDAHVAPGIKLADESAAAAIGRGMRERATFSYRGIDIEYAELPDSESNLLFGNVLWPAAETLSKLLIDQSRGGAKLWTADAAMQLGMPLDMLIERRFGLRIELPPSPTALEWLGLTSVVPDVSIAGTKVLEVGAGVGLTGLACHALGASVLLTDGEARLVDALRARHPSGDDATLRFAQLDWHMERFEALAADSDPDDGTRERFDLILGCEVLNPACCGEVHVPALVHRRLARTPGARAMLLSEVRSVETCFTAVHTLAMHGLRVAAFQVMGREAFQVRLDELPGVGPMLLLVATWPPRTAADSAR